VEQNDCHLVIFALHYPCKNKKCHSTKKKGLTSKYISKFQTDLLRRDDMNAKVEIEIKKELTKANHS
jgi:hypothetical protein